MYKISKQQLVEASGEFSQVATSEGLAFSKDTASLCSPGMLEVKRVLGVDGPESVLALRPQQATELWRVPLTRVIAGVRTKKGAAFLPAVVLPDSRIGDVRLGCLFAPEDIRQASAGEAQAALTDFQQVLLAKIAAEHQPGIGEHGRSGNINGAEIGHAAVAAATRNPNGIHHRVHTLVDGGQFAAQLSASGATDMQFGHNLRQNRDKILSVDQVAGIIIVDAHQLPFPVSDAFEVSAGFTLAAQQSRGQAPDLARNLASMVSS